VSDPDAIVVGAGYAGLAAALDLLDAGASVAVLEARNRVGGRVRSAHLANGAIAELGGEWIFEGYQELVELAGRFGLALAPTGTDFGRRAVVDLDVSLEEQDAFLAAAEDALRATGRDALERGSIGAFLSGVPGDARVRTAVMARLQGTCAMDLAQVALAAGVDLLRPGGAGPSFRLAEGNQALADRIAAEVPDLRLGHVVGLVEHESDGVRVAFRDGPLAGELRGGTAVLAVPPPVLRALALEPRPPAEVEAALAGMGFGPTSKLVVPLPAEPELFARQSVGGPFWWWSALGDDGRPRRCVTSFAGSAAARAELRTAAGDPRPWLDRLRSLDPDVRAGGEPVLVDWASDPFAGGGYSAIPPGAPGLLSALERPLGPIVLCGEHTAGPRWHGTMEGAIRSGRRAASQVLKLLSHG
jgi:monoamine oxidase